MKSAIVEREAGDLAAERVVLQEGIQRFPTFAKLHLMLGQLEERAGNTGVLGAHVILSCLLYRHLNGWNRDGMHATQTRARVWVACMLEGVWHQATEECLLAVSDARVAHLLLMRSAQGGPAEASEASAVCRACST